MKVTATVTITFQLKNAKAVVADLIMVMNWVGAMFALRLRYVCTGDKYEIMPLQCSIKLHKNIATLC